MTTQLCFQVNRNPKLWKNLGEIRCAPAKSTVLAIAQFLRTLAGGRLPRAANNRMTVTVTKVDVRGNSVILLDTPDLGSLVNGREVVARDILNLVSKWLRKSR